MTNAEHMRTKFNKILNMLRSFLVDVSTAKAEFATPETFARWLLDDAIVSPSRVARMVTFFLDDETRGAEKMLRRLVRAEEKILAREARVAAPVPGGRKAEAPLTASQPASDDKSDANQSDDKSDANQSARSSSRTAKIEAAWAKRSAAQKAAWAVPGMREKHSAAGKAAWGVPGRREKHSAACAATKACRHAARSMGNGDAR